MTLHMDRAMCAHTCMCVHGDIHANKCEKILLRKKKRGTGKMAQQLSMCVLFLEKNHDGCSQ